MVRNILIVTASEAEAAIFSDIESGSGVFGSLNIGGTKTTVLVSGIGTMACARSLLNHFHRHGKPDLAINAGIAGSFNPELAIGSSAVVIRDCFADFGIDDRGKFIQAADAGLVAGEANPYSVGGWIECNNTYTKKLAGRFRFCTGITSDTVSGSPERISVLKNRYNPDLETMESASFFYICALEKVPFIAVRSISNMVEERNRDSWNVPLALQSLHEITEGIFRTIV